MPVFWVLHLKALRNVNLWPGAPPHSAAIWGQTNSHYAWVNIRDLEGPTVVLTALSGFYTLYIIIQFYSIVLVHVFIFLDIKFWYMTKSAQTPSQLGGAQGLHTCWRRFFPSTWNLGDDTLWDDAGNPCDGLMIHHFSLETHGIDMFWVSVYMFLPSKSWLSWGLIYLISYPDRGLQKLLFFSILQKGDVKPGRSTI